MISNSNKSQTRGAYLGVSDVIFVTTANVALLRNDAVALLSDATVGKASVTKVEALGGAGTARG